MEVLEKEQTAVADTTANQNFQAAHSAMVMEQWGYGEIYNEATWVERGRHAVRQTMEGMFELGRVLIVLKEHTEYRRFSQIETFAKKPFLRQPKPKHRFSAVFSPNHS